MYHFKVNETVIKKVEFFFSDIQELQSVKVSRHRHLSGAPTDRFSKLPVQNALKLVQFSEENSRLKLL